MLRNALRFAAGAALASAVWWFAAPAYVRFLTAAAEPLVRIDSNLGHAEILSAGLRVRVRGDERQPDLPPIVFPADQVAYNVILLAGLFAADPGMAGRTTGGKPSARIGRLLAMIAILAGTHVIALAVGIEATYAGRLGNWSSARYTAGAQDFWTAVEYSYRLAGMFAIAFGLWWWLLNDSSRDRIFRGRSTA